MFGWHLACSLCALSVVLGGLYLGWYRWPGWYLANALRIAPILCAVDVALGPLLTLLIANPAKPRRALARDISIIAAVQFGALVYGASTLWNGRPLYYAFSEDRLQLVQASDLRAELSTPQPLVAAPLAPHWYSLPRWIWAPLPSDPSEALRIAQSATLGGADVVQLPRYFRPWELGLAELRAQLRGIDEWPYFSRMEKERLHARLAARRIPSGRNTLVLWGGTRRVLVVFDPQTLRVAGVLRADS